MATHLHLVLPNQSTIMTWDLNEWKKRELFRQTMIDLSEQVYTKSIRPNHYMEFQIVAACTNIGHHIGRENPKHTLVKLVTEQKNTYPTQLFLSGNVQSKIDIIPDMDIAVMNDHIIRHSQCIYVHSPYCINLCTTPGAHDNYFTKSLAYHLEVSAAIGFKGVVVHTGKLCKPGYSMENLETNVWTVLANATVDCPLLIETPAREGTEQLNDPEQLAEFVMRFHKDCALGTEAEMKRKIGICVDTCHVFAAGHQPLDYIKILDECDQSLIWLVHYNDSLFPFDSHRDYHATPGTGEVSWAQLSEVAVTCVNRNIPMVVE
jgi:deoxyribonuclease-4